uniref:Methylenetetrahydrofolate reductase (NADPH) n=1 Tax=Parascaris univalens TaxID=6257 RepID=A0A915BX02_PARUN
ASESNTTNDGMKKNDSLPVFPYSGGYMNGEQSGSSLDGENLSERNRECNGKLSLHGGSYIPLHERITKRINDNSPFFSLETEMR